MKTLKGGQQAGVSMLMFADQTTTPFPMYWWPKPIGL
jgi:hypothetical protein